MSTTTLDAFWSGFASSTFQWFQGQQSLFFLIFGTFTAMLALFLIVYGMTFFFKGKRR